MADVNADGLLDIYLSGVGGYKEFNGFNQLFINNGDLTFSERSKEFGLDFQGFSTHAAFFDYDLDGDFGYVFTQSLSFIRSGRMEISPCATKPTSNRAIAYIKINIQKQEKNVF
jgi:hypothetical protein